jgi:hypothetical protein
MVKAHCINVKTREKRILTLTTPTVEVKKTAWSSTCSPPYGLSVGTSEGSGGVRAVPRQDNPMIQELV